MSELPSKPRSEPSFGFYRHYLRGRLPEVVGPATTRNWTVRVSGVFDTKRLFEGQPNVKGLKTTPILINL